MSLNAHVPRSLAPKLADFPVTSVEKLRYADTSGRLVLGSKSSERQERAIRGSRQD
jgi:hypothetical protein